MIWFELVFEICKKKKDTLLDEMGEGVWDIGLTFRDLRDFVWKIPIAWNKLLDLNTRC